MGKIKLGDAVAKLAKALHIPHCQKCERRRLVLNEIQKFGVKETIRRLRVVNAIPEGWTVEEIVKKMQDCCGDK